MPPISVPCQQNKQDAVRGLSRYTFWAYTLNDVQVPITYHSVPVGQPSPLDTGRYAATEVVGFGQYSSWRLKTLVGSAAA